MEVKEYFYTCGCYAGGDACVSRTCAHHNEGKLCETKEDYDTFIREQLKEIGQIKKKADALNREICDAINLATRAKKAMNALNVKTTE